MAKKKFSLPRKTKKRLKKGIWLYPADEKGNSVMAFPARSQKDYDAYKKGLLRKLGRSVKERKVFNKALNGEVEVSNEDLELYVNDIFRESSRKWAYNLLIKAKYSKSAKMAYYNFVNAYHLYGAGNDSYGNICCLAVDLVKEKLKKKK